MTTLADRFLELDVAELREVIDLFECLRDYRSGVKRDEQERQRIAHILDEYLDPCRVL